MTYPKGTDFNLLLAAADAAYAGLTSNTSIADIQKALVDPTSDLMKDSSFTLSGAAVFKDRY